MQFLLVLLLTIGLVAATPLERQFSSRGTSATASCGYDSCPALATDGRLNVHLVPHTHDDVGWLKTPEQYYFGGKNYIQNAAVDLILNSVVEELQKAPERRFIYVEMWFFFHWWDRQTAEKQAIVQKLVQNGQLEFINGGWCMSDEAAPHYGPMVDQMSLGLRRLRATFGQCGVPRVAWQIDPFGHSREIAAQAALFGMDGLVFARADYQDINQRAENKSLEMIWRGNPTLSGHSADILTHIMASGSYGPPPSMCWDIGCSDEPIIDDKTAEDYNVVQVTDFFDSYLRSFSAEYQSGNVMIPFGSDFQYQVASRYYDNLDLLIKYMGQRYGDKYNLIYSTPSCYLKALNSAQGLTWPTKDDDFFPYGNDPHSYWTGYFTSRPALKGYERLSNNVLLMSKQLSALANYRLTDPVPSLAGNETVGSVLYTHASAQGVAQHHDAVSGTAKQHVTDDYAKLLYKGQVASEALIGQALQKLIPLPGSASTSGPSQFFCHAMNETACADLGPSGAAINFTVTLYNSLTRARDVFVQIALPYAPEEYSVSVQDPSGAVVPSLHIVSFAKKDSTWDLQFYARSLPALGFSTYFVTVVKASESDLHANRIHATTHATFVDSHEAHRRGLRLGGADFELGFDVHGALMTYKRINSDPTPFKQVFKYYQGYTGHNRNPSDRASGAYIFRPNGTTPLSVATGDVPAKSQFVLDPAGKVIEVRQTWTDWISQIIRINEVDQVAEFEWTIGPIPVEDNIGKEIITQYVTDLASGGIFATDANGRQTMQRARDSRSSFKFNLTEPVSQNYYPVNTRISLNNATAGDNGNATSLLVLTDRSEGGTSLVDGTLELMIHRRLLWDDAFGVGEALNEPGEDGRGLIIRGTHRLFLGPLAEAGRRSRDLANKYWNTPNAALAFSVWDGSYAGYTAKFRAKYSNLSAELPANVNLFTLEPVENPLTRQNDNRATVLLRLEHLYAPEDDATLSKPVDVDVCALLGTHSLSLQETALGGDRLLSDVHRMSWTPRDEVVPAINGDSWTYSSAVRTMTGDTCTVHLESLQIRTFLVTFA